MYVMYNNYWSSSHDIPVYNVNIIGLLTRHQFLFRRKRMSLNTSVQVAKMYNVPVIKTYIIITILYIMQVSVTKYAMTDYLILRPRTQNKLNGQHFKL